MTNFSCCCKVNCTGLALVASVLIGIIAAFLQFLGFITLSPLFVAIVGGIAILFLALLLVLSPAIRNSDVRACACPILRILLLAVLGAILLAVILLAFPPAAASFLFALLVGALIFFLSLLFATLACFIRCVAGCLLSSDAA
ncbi:MAG: hypothetical protein IJN25_10280 [Clostridia bacterium]|nr:hypothetical protein [Oscillospiraceae bacterium]MBQ7034028.1 hypothetical protein [Clostridia bacterium]